MTVGAQQRCILSLELSNIYLEHINLETLDYNTTILIGG